MYLPLGNKNLFIYVFIYLWANMNGMLGHLTFGLAKGVMLHYQACKWEVWGSGV
jgi:hypothetical protein